MLHIKPYNRLHCTQRTCDSISFIDSGLRLSSTSCLSDSLCEAGRRAASSPAYMKPLEVNFLIKAPQPPHSPSLPAWKPLQLCEQMCVCVCAHALACMCLCTSMWVVYAYLNECICECICTLCLCLCLCCGVYWLVCKVHVCIYVFHVFMKPN